MDAGRVGLRGRNNRNPFTLYYCNNNCRKAASSKNRYQNRHDKLLCPPPWGALWLVFSFAAHDGRNCTTSRFNPPFLETASRARSSENCSTKVFVEWIRPGSRVTRKLRTLSSASDT